MSDLERLALRPAEFAEAVGISRSKAYEILARREVETIRVGGCIRVPMESVRRWIAQQLTGQLADRA